MLNQNQTNITTSLIKTTVKIDFDVKNTEGVKIYAHSTVFIY